MKKRILCFGDSNTWGLNPKDGSRYLDDVRWTGVLANELGDEYIVIENGLNGRTTCFDKPWNNVCNGRYALNYALNENYPLDAVVIMLGTNDLSLYNAAVAKKGVESLVHMVLNANEIYNQKIFENKPKVLLIAPPLLDPEIKDTKIHYYLADKYSESLKFAEYYKQVADRFNVEFLDAALYTKASKIDCLHIDELSHKQLGIEVSKKIKEMFK